MRFVLVNSSLNRKVHEIFARGSDRSAERRRYIASTGLDVENPTLRHLLFSCWVRPGRHCTRSSHMNTRVLHRISRVQPLSSSRQNCKRQGEGRVKGSPEISINLVAILQWHIQTRRTGQKCVSIKVEVLKRALRTTWVASRDSGRIDARLNKRRFYWLRRRGAIFPDREKRSVNYGVYRTSMRTLVYVRVYSKWWAPWS